MQRHVPSLGVIDGLSRLEHPFIEQYNGIPYGSISARFKQSKLVTSWPDERWDGKIYGPICPFPKIVIGSSIVQKRLPPQHDYRMDEFQCLNLNITCPKEGSSGNGYPVVVWVHGGGNCVGSGSTTEYNGAALVSHSVEKGLPIVLVTFKCVLIHFWISFCQTSISMYGLIKSQRSSYRLGAFGFLASESIKDDNESTGDGGCGNYGVRDQILAYQWVGKHIEAFGGDSRSITVMGESAGSIDIHIALCSEETTSLPFHQAILQSGVAPLTVRTLQHQQDVYDKLVAFNKVQARSPEEELRILREVSADDLVKSYVALGGPVVSWQATVDGVFLKTAPKVSTLSALQYPRNLKRLLIGDCAMEGLIFIDKIRKAQWTFDRWEALAVEHLGKQQTMELAQAYGLSSSGTPEQFLTGLIKLSSDVDWSQPINATARSFSNGEVFYYHMSEGNPFDGPNKGNAHHGVDLLYVFLNYQSHLPANLAKLAETICTQWLTFTNGGKPWIPYEQKSDGASKLMIYGPDGHSALEPENQKPAYDRLQLVRAMQDEILHFSALIRGENIRG